MGEQRSSPTRRRLLRAVGLAAAAATAGCTVEVAGYEVAVAEGDEVIRVGRSDETEPTPTFGYGGTPTPSDAPGEGPTPTPEQTDRPDPGDTPTPGRTPTPDRTPTRTASGEYGVQRYGEYGYGGVGR